MFAGGKCKDPQYEPLYQEAAAGNHIPTPAAIIIGQAVRGIGSMSWHQINADSIMAAFKLQTGGCQMAWTAGKAVENTIAAEARSCFWCPLVVQDPHKESCDAIIPCFGSKAHVILHDLGAPADECMADAMCLKPSSDVLHVLHATCDLLVLATGHQVPRLSSDDTEFLQKLIQP